MFNIHIKIILIYFGLNIAANESQGMSHVAVIKEYMAHGAACGVESVGSPMSNARPLNIASMH